MTASLAPWRGPLARALHRNRSQPQHRYLQLATIRVDGTPANRTLVFRGLVDDSNQLVMVTDARSEKVGQLAEHGQGEICWYFAKTREQFRLHGTLQVIGAEDEHPGDQRLRLQRWQQFSGQGRVQFYWPDPGLLRTAPDVAFTDVEVDAEEPPAVFTLLLMEPSWVDHLELREQPQRRTRYQCQPGGRWSEQIINP